MTSQFPDPQRVRLDSLLAVNEAIDRLFGLAQQSIAIFDIDLSDAAWNSRERNESLQRFLHASRGNRVRVVLNDCDHVDRYHARLMLLLRQFSDRMEVRLNSAEGRHWSDPFVLVDKQHYLHRFHYEHARSEFGIAQPEPANERRRWRKTQPRSRTPRIRLRSAARPTSRSTTAPSPSAKRS